MEDAAGLGPAGLRPLEVRVLSPALEGKSLLLSDSGFLHLGACGPDMAQTFTVARIEEAADVLFAVVH